MNELSRHLPANIMNSLIAWSPYLVERVQHLRLGRPFLCLPLTSLDIIDQNALLYVFNDRLGCVEPAHGTVGMERSAMQMAGNGAKCSLLDLCLGCLLGTPNKLPLLHGCGNIDNIQACFVTRLPVHAFKIGSLTSC